MDLMAFKNNLRKFIIVKVNSSFAIFLGWFWFVRQLLHCISLRQEELNVRSFRRYRFPSDKVIIRHIVDLLCDRIYHTDSCIRGNLSGLGTNWSLPASKWFSLSKAKHTSVNSAKDIKEIKNKLNWYCTANIKSKRSTDIIQVAYWKTN